MKATSPFASDEEYASRNSPVIVVNEHSPIACTGSHVRVCPGLTCLGIYMDSLDRA
jgi:hypothetical protein